MKNWQLVSHSKIRKSKVLKNRKTRTHFVGQTNNTKFSLLTLWILAHLTWTCRFVSMSACWRAQSKNHNRTCCSVGQLCELLERTQRLRFERCQWHLATLRGVDFLNLVMAPPDSSLTEVNVLVNTFHSGFVNWFDKFPNVPYRYVFRQMFSGVSHLHWTPLKSRQTAKIRTTVVWGAWEHKSWSSACPSIIHKSLEYIIPSNYAAFIAIHDTCKSQT